MLQCFGRENIKISGASLHEQKCNINGEQNGGIFHNREKCGSTLDEITEIQSEGKYSQCSTIGASVPEQKHCGTLDEKTLIQNWSSPPSTEMFYHGMS